MGWIDELIEVEFASGKDPPKDPPEERKSKIKKLIREELNKNPVLSNVLRENKAEGKFIKEFTDKIICDSLREGHSDERIKNTVRVTINSRGAIDRAIIWRHTKQGHEYWSKINKIVINELSK